MHSLEKLKIIAKAKFSNKNNLGSWYQDRLSICNDCPLNTANKPSLTLKEQAFVVANLGKPTCIGCGCEIAAKASVRGEQCGIVNKGHAPLWESLPEIEEVSLKGLKVENLNSDRAILTTEKRGLALDYGTVVQGAPSDVKFTIKSSVGEISNIKTVSGCGCTTASASYDAGMGIIQVEYDTVGRVGAATKTINIYFMAGRVRASLRCTININVLN